jgi:hypothetical protein
MIIHTNYPPVSTVKNVRFMLQVRPIINAISLDCVHQYEYQINFKLQNLFNSKLPWYSMVSFVPETKSFKMLEKNLRL